MFHRLEHRNGNLKYAVKSLKNRHEKFENLYEKFENRHEKFENRHEKFEHRNEKFENRHGKFGNRFEMPDICSIDARWHLERFPIDVLKISNQCSIDRRSVFNTISIAVR